MQATPKGVTQPPGGIQLWPAWPRPFALRSASAFPPSRHTSHQSHLPAPCSRQRADERRIAECVGLRWWQKGRGNRTERKGQVRQRRWVPSSQRGAGSGSSGAGRHSEPPANHPGGTGSWMGIQLLLHCNRDAANACTHTSPSARAATQGRPAYLHPH